MITKNGIRTGKKMATRASKVLTSKKSSKLEKMLGGGVLVNRKRTTKK